jgi:methylated-DNA-[protein]-cysteine S-methyltransferase
MKRKISIGRYSFGDFNFIFYYENKILTKLKFVSKKEADKLTITNNKDSFNKKIILELDNYFSGKIKKFPLKINPEGTNFQKKVWQELTKIQYGQTKTYKDIAVGISNQKAARAVGMACNKNPIPIIIPCHRVIGSKGNLVGYNSGLGVKKWLLDFENKNGKQNFNDKIKYL